MYADGRSGAVPVRRLPGGDSGRDGQPDCQRRGDEQGLDVGQHGDLALFPLPPVRFIVASGSFNGRAFAIQGEERPLGREVIDEGEGSRMAWPQYTTTLAECQPRFLHTRPAPLARWPRVGTSASRWVQRPVAS